MDSRQPLAVDGDDQLAALIALGGLPNLTPKRFWSLLDLGPPTEVWRRVIAGGAPRNGRRVDAADKWVAWAARVDPSSVLASHRHAKVRVAPFGHDGYPPALLDDPDPPVVVFRRGPLPLEGRVRVGIVGTRKCSLYGRDIAHELGARLADRGVDVVSGLAHGIDAAAHFGAHKRGPGEPIGVVAGGVNVVFPRGNAGLYRSVAADGVILSEWPLGASPERWRFPARNRLIAALSAAIVVVESGEKGGSMYTVDEAIRRDRMVFAVPGSVHSPVSAGTNRLIADGATPLYRFDELLDAVAPRPAGSAPDRQGLAAPRSSWLLDIVGWEPMSLDRVVAESGRAVADVTLEVERMIAAGCLRRLGGVVEQIP